MDVAEYRRRQDLALAPLVKLIRALVHALGVPVTDEQTQEFALRLYRPVVSARDLNYQIALAYLASLDLPAGIVIPQPRGYPFAAMTSTIERTVPDLRIDGDPVTEDNRADVRVIEQARTALEGPVTRQVQEPARETVAAIGESEDGPHERYGWARVLVGASSCAFCAMLASRGPVYTSKEAATGRGGSGLGAYHTAYVNKNGKTVGGKCDCVAVLVPKGSTSWEGHAAHQRLDELWQDTTEGEHYTDALNTFRREWDKRVREGKTDRYVPDSVKQPTPPAPGEVDKTVSAEHKPDQPSDSRTAHDEPGPKSPETRLDKALRELNEAIESGDDERISAAADLADKLETEAARQAEYRDQRKRGIAERVGKLIEGGSDPAEAEAEVTGKAVESIRRRDFMAQARADGHTGASFEKLLTAVHTERADEAYWAAEAATHGFMLKRQYEGKIDPRELWSVSEATARKYMSDEMAEWFDQHGRITRAILRDMVLSGSNIAQRHREDFLQ